MAVVVHCDPALPLQSVGRAVAPHLAQPTVLMRLRSRHLTAADWAEVDEAANTNGTLLLDAQAAPDLVFDVLERYRRDRSLASGLCVLLHGVRRDVAERLREELLPLTILPDDEILGAEAAPIDCREIGRPPTGLSFKDLCLLHHRDEGPMQPYRSASAIFGGREPLHWQDMQVLLRQQPDVHMLQILADLRTAGRLSTSQFDLAEAAVFFLRREGPFSDERSRQGEVASSIHELVWSHRQRGDLYRGQRRASWHQVPSLLAPGDDGTSPDVATVVERAGRTQRFVDALARHEQAWFSRALTDDERLAIAQHYGMPTPLLDYTRSFAIAAFFASGAGDRSAPVDGDIGIVLRVAARRLVPAAGLDLMEAAGVRPGRLRVIEPRLSGAEDRIGRQQGVFIDGFSSRDLQHLADTALHFRQHAGECFEDARQGISRAALLDPDSRLNRLTNRINRHRSSTTPLAGTLRTLRLESDGAFYGLGSWIGTNLAKGQRLVDLIAAAASRLDPAHGPALRSIIERHFEHARAAVRTAEHGLSSTLRAVASGGDVRRLDDVDTALFETAERLGLDSDAFVARMQRCRPAAQPTPDELRILDTQFRGRPEDPRERLALAVAGLVIAFEHLRRVRGALADQFLTAANDLLEER